jgi:Secretion system C-terminal sorting domain
MKTFLLFAAFAVSALVGTSQSLPLFENFSNGTPAGWTLVSSQVGPYNRNVVNVCTPNQGVISSPSIGSNGNNKTGFKTSALNSVTLNSFVTVTFRGYVYGGPQLRCQDQLFASTPCVASGQIIIYSEEDGSIIGMSDTIALNLTTGINVLVAQVTTPVPPATQFRVLLDISDVDCGVNGSIRFVVDDVSITATAGGPLPVYFKSFTAVRSNQNVSLNWETATEQNNQGFYVQRNINGTWEDLGFVPTKAVNGNSSNDISYSFADINKVKGITQYRIVQVDLNGQVRLSEIRAVRGEQAGKIVVFPNPAPEGKANLLFDTQNDTRDVSLIDASGRTVKQWSNVRGASMQLTDLKSGFYYIRIVNQANGEQAMEKLIVK